MLQKLNKNRRSPRSASSACKSRTTTRLKSMQLRISANEMPVSARTCRLDISRSFPITELSASMGFVSITTRREMVRFAVSSSQPRLPQTKPAAIAKNSTSIFSISAGTFISTSFQARAAPAALRMRQAVGMFWVSRSSAGRACSRLPRRACGCMPRSWSARSRRSRICGRARCRRSRRTRHRNP